MSSNTDDIPAKNLDEEIISNNKVELSSEKLESQKNKNTEDKGKDNASSNATK